MESQPQNPEFRNNPENFHPCTVKNVCFFTHAPLKMFVFSVLLCLCFHIPVNS